MIVERLPQDTWIDEGGRAAPALEEVAAAIVTGRDPEATAAVALGIARAHAGERRVVVVDLVGGIPSLTPLADQPGLLECLRDGEPLSGIGQPDAGHPNVYLLPSGQGPIAERWVFESARWERLVAGFREVDALLLLVTDPYTPGHEVLVERVDGVVAVDLPPRDLRSFPLLASIDHPEPDLPPIVVANPSLPVEGAKGSKKGARGGMLRVAVVALGVLSVVGGLAWVGSREGDAQPTSADVTAIVAPEDSRAQPGALASDASPLAEPPFPAPEVPVIEVALGPIVNPWDSVRVAGFAVELVAANTLASANSSFAFRSGPPPVPAVTPAQIGGGGSPWYHATVGAWGDRRDAEAWLAARRAAGELRPTAGRVVALPLALLLEEGVSPRDAAGAVRRWQDTLGVPAYALMDQDGGVRIYAGAFATASQGAWLAATVRDAGVTPRLAYRTGRTF